MPIDASIQRKVASMSDEMTKLRQQHKDNMSAQSDQVANKLDMLKNKKQQILDAERKRAKATNQSANKDSATASHSEQVDVTLAVDAMLNEKAAVGGFNYEKEINDKLKKMGKADKDSTTAGSSADAPDAKFTHGGEEHHLEVKQNSKAMFGQIELHHDGKKWDISERSKKKYPATHAAIAATGFLKKINKQWDKPSGDYDTDLQLGNVYHTHHDAEPIKAHYGTDRKTNYIQIGGGHGFYHTGNDAAGLGSPELEGKATLRARMKYRGTDRKTGKKKYGALIVMGLKDAEKSHHNLDESIQKKWILDALQGHELFESKLNPKDPHKDYTAKRKALHDLSLNKDVDQTHVQQRRLDLDKEYAKYQKESINEEHLVHVNDGSKYDDEPHPDDVKHVMAGVKKYNGKHDGSSDKGAYFKFKSHEDAKNFKRHVDSCPKRSCDADLHEAHKMGDKVEIVKGSAKGTTGRIGEIRHGAFKGAPKTYTVYHGEKDATQVKKEHIKALKEDMLQLRKMLDKHTEKALAANKQGDDEKVKHHQRMMNKVKDQMSKLVKENLNEEAIPFVDAFWSGQQEEPKQNPYAEDTAEYTEYENGYMQGVMTRRRMQTESRGHKTLETFFKKRNAWSATGKEGTHRETGEKTKEYQEVDDEGKPTGNRHWRNAKGQNMGESHAPVAPVPDKKYIKGTPEYQAHKATKKPINGHPTNVKEDSEQIDEISQKLAGNYYGAATKKHIEKVGVKPNMYDRIEKDMGKKRKEGIDRAFSRLTKEEVVQEEGEGAVPANNAGDGKIAGFQGDAGKKVKMMSQPLKRKPLPKFKMYVSQEHDR